MIDRRTMWESAGKAGLVLGLVSVAYGLIGLLLAKVMTAGVFMSIITFLLWAAKFYLCIYLMKLFMTRYAATDPEIDNSGTFRFGAAVALLSAIIVSAYSLANILFLSPDLIEESFNTVLATYSSMLDANSLDAIDMIKNSLPNITFFSNLIYCFLFGTILSAILSRNIPSRNPFEKMDSKDSEDYI